MTIASAMSGTVSDTRVIVAPTFRIVERPTSRSMSVALISAAGGAVAVGPPFAANEEAGCCAACGAATRMTMMNTTSAATNERCLPRDSVVQAGFMGSSKSRQI